MPLRLTFPFTLAPKKKLTLAFTANFNCFNDPLASNKSTPHSDCRTIVTVNVSALGPGVYLVPANDVCPRPAYRPTGDEGCGGKNPDGTLGADVLTDVFLKHKQPKGDQT